MSIKSYELIYVDSRSSDRSIEVVSRFPEVKIFSITGECNAAIARNIGAIEATGPTLFFIDADMELNSTFLDNLFNEDNNLKHDVVTGKVIDVVDDKVTPRKHVGGDKFLSWGVFLIKRSIWQQVNGMTTKYKTGEDPDLGLRLSRKRVSFYFKPETIVKHYMVHYLDRRRVWKRLIDKSSFYYRCVLYRDHIFNSNMYRLLYTFDKTFLIFLLSCIFSVLFPVYLPIFALLYFAAILVRSIKQEKILLVPEFVIYFALFDFLNTVYLFLFYPKAHKISYTTI
jgi:glycosyltransferase involved in cell wall biosynthesis